MATTATDRLGLKKQANADNPGTWEVDLNQGFDDADDRLFLSGAGNPHGVITSNYIGQRYLDSVTELWYTAQTLGATADWVSDFDIIDPLVTHDAPPETYFTYGLLQAHLEWVSATSVRLSPTLGTTVRIHLDVAGVDKIVENAGALLFDIVTHHHGATAEAASQANYLYVENDVDDDTIDVHVSASAPYDINGTKPGFHTTENTWRCVGSIWNDSGSDLSKFIMGRDGLVLFDGITRDHTDHTMQLSLAEQSAYRNQVLAMPVTATSVLLQLMHKASGSAGYAAFAQDGATSIGLPTDAPIHLLSDVEFVEAEVILQGGAGDYMVVAKQFNLPNRVVPAFNYGHNRTSTPDLLQAVLMGYWDIWAPKGF